MAALLGATLALTLAPVTPPGVPIMTACLAALIALVPGGDDCMTRPRGSPSSRSAATLVVTKGIGPVALGNRELPRPFTKVIDLLAPAILAALIAVGTFTNADGDLVIDARAAGLAAAAAVYAVSRKSILLGASARLRSPPRWSAPSPESR